MNCKCDCQEELVYECTTTTNSDGKHGPRSTMRAIASLACTVTKGVPEHFHNKYKGLTTSKHLHQIASMWWRDRIAHVDYERKEAKETQQSQQGWNNCSCFNWKHNLQKTAHFWPSEQKHFALETCSSLTHAWSGHHLSATRHVCHYSNPYHDEKSLPRVAPVRSSRNDRTIHYIT